MAKIVVIGAGMGGLAASLFLARRGHDVEVFERDADAPPEGADACFDSWARRGVAQARQAHMFLGLSAKVLEEEAPDVPQAVVDAGALDLRQFDIRSFGIRRFGV